MSLILDALKKLEQEKAGRSRKTTDLGPAIVGSDQKETGSRGKTAIIVGAAVVATALGTVAVINMSGWSPVPDEKRITAAQEPTPAAPSTTPIPVVEPTPAPPDRQRTQQLPPPVAVALPPSAKTAPPTAAPVELKVTGIAWQEDRLSRRAVVNGTLVSEGSRVSGATVRNIQPDRVLFDVGNEQVEVTNTTPFQ